MPLSTFDGEPTVHRHYDADGNLTGTTEIPGWSADDRTWALSLLAREDNRCPRGHDLSESTDKEFAWVPQPPVVCFACVAADAAAKAHEKDSRRGAMLHPLKKVPRPTRQRKRRG